MTQTARPSRFYPPVRWTGPALLACVALGSFFVTLHPFVEADETRHGIVTLSIVGTNDLHGRIFSSEGRGGLALLAGYLDNLRARRAADGGAVLLFDAGDTYQGGIESNLSEGAVVIDAYNALGYTAAAIGNHDFEFGAIDRYPPSPVPGADLRGALKARAEQASFPFLAANLIDEQTGRPVNWPNVRPSVMVRAADVQVGVIGVMTLDALRLTLAANVEGLRVAPLAPAVEAEAATLRADGAEVVVVVSHAGGYCERFDDPDDLSSCDEGSEMFAVARRLPPGLVNVIVAGHTHGGLAHRVAGVAIIEAFSQGRAFGRVDLRFDRRTKRVVDTVLFAPQVLCAGAQSRPENCAGSGPAMGPAEYEGRVVAADGKIGRAMQPALARVQALRDASLGVVLDTVIGRDGEHESPIANLFADAMRESVPGADAAVGYAVGPGGLRTDLPPGLLTFGALYDVFPFDNRMVTVSLSGAQLRQVFLDAISRRGRGALAVSGIRVLAGCDGMRPRVAVERGSGLPIPDHERLRVVTTDFLVQRSPFAIITTDEVAPPFSAAPIAREVVATWLERRGGRLRDRHLVNPIEPRWRDDQAAPLSRCAPGFSVQGSAQPQGAGR